ncbi:hypothetical protein ACQY0O_000970 [Thecaphora frezii]|nr:putative subtilisin-like protease [Thecaphora frezii]
MKVSSLLFAGPIAVVGILSLGPTHALAAAANAIEAGPLPIAGLSRISAEKKASITKKTVALKRSTSPYVPRGFIVELEPSASTYNAGDKRSQAINEVHEHLAARGKKGAYTTRYEWNDPKTFVGMSVILDSDDDLHLLLSAPNVRAVYRNRLYSLPAYDPVVASNDFVQTTVGSKQANVKRASSDASGAEPGVKDTFSPHTMTGVDKLHAAGYFGKGQTVGIIDTGIDYTHPALGGKPGYKPCFGHGCKVIGGYDFVGDNYNGTNTPEPDDDPFADCPGSGHGTHVAGTIAANDTALGFTGVAPHAQLRSYRVFGCGSSASDDVIISALQRAFFDGNDILSLSLGGPGGWVSSSSATVAGRIVALGTPVVVANGNEGAYGTYYGSAPSTGDGVAAIGSVNNVQLTGYVVEVVPSGLGLDSVTYLVGSPFKFNGSSTLEIYATSTDPEVTNDACNPLPNSTPDLSNKVVVVGRGTCTFATKFQNIWAKGGKYVLVYNTPDPASITYVSSSIPGQSAASLTRAAGQFLVKQFAAGKKISLDFSNLSSRTETDTVSGGLMSSFSTYGLTNENRLVPQISAPGGNILSTWPVKLGNYSIISGTSMATPFVSGAFAVYRAGHGGKTSPETLRTIFGSTGSPLRQTKSNSSEYETLVKQGSGLIQAFDAFNQELVFSPHAIELNDTAHFAGPQKITIKNTGHKARTYTLKHQAVGTAISKTSDSNVLYNDYPVPLTSQYASVKFSTSQLKIAAGGSASFTVTVTPPTGLDGKKLPVYSGYIQLVPTGSDYTGLRIPYSGVVGDVSAGPVIDGTNELFGIQLPFLSTDGSGATPVTDDSHVFTLDGSQASTPNFYYRFAFGSPKYQIDVVHANTTFKPTIPIRNASTQAKRAVNLAQEGQEGFHVVRRGPIHQHVFQERAPAAAAEKETQAGALFSDVETVGTLFGEVWVGRNSDTGLEDDYSYIRIPLLRDLSLPQGSSTTLADGEYKILFRAQRPFTSGKNEADYESYLSHKFTVKRASA